MLWRCGRLTSECERLAIDADLVPYALQKPFLNFGLGNQTLESSSVGVEDVWDEGGGIGDEFALADELP